MYKEKLDKIRSEHLAEIEFRRNKTKQSYRHEVMVCSSTGCKSSGSNEIFEELDKVIAEKNLKDQIRVTQTGCFGLCSLGPIVIVYPEGIFYCKVQKKDIEEIVEKHLLGGEVITRLLFKDENPENRTKQDIKFYNKQMFVARKDSEFINPERIEDYIAIDGYQALYKAINEMTPEQVIEEMKNSGLRGRGGAGFPTGKKWEFARLNKSDRKYIVCNADEGDPGAFMDRSIIESNPHAILEAMTIAGYAIGATEGYVYVRAEYPLAGERLVKAIKDAEEHGYLGENIFGKFSFKIGIKYGAGAFVCGEETALLSSMEGHRGEPNTKPPFPAESGYLGQPTIINNVETLANIPQIIRNGADWYKTIGTENSAGTKVFALTGKVNHSGLIELPMGTTLREIIYDVGGGIPKGKKFKAVQIGGPSGTCIPESQLDVKIDYDNLAQIGSMMGSGGLIVLDEDSCMVDVAKFFLEFTCDESCGKCTPCRVGNKRLLEILTKITQGKGELSDLDKLEELCAYIKENSLCGLGQTSPNPVVSTLKHFRDEYVAHIVDKKCPAGVCKDLTSYSIDKSKCIGCSACSRVCPVEAITRDEDGKFVIDAEKCVKCGSCYNTCRFGAIKR